MASFEGTFTGASGLRIAIVVARFNDLVTGKLLSGCLDCLSRHGIDTAATSTQLDTAWVPGSFEIGGVSIPGLPGVPIGYSRAVAWSATNTGADVMDFWREKVDTDTAPTAHELDGVMTKFADTRIETYRDKVGHIIDTDTIYYTHRGPMQRQGREWLSMRWTVLESGKG